jgi:predicted amidohydrolase YtcJ
VIRPAALSTVLLAAALGCGRGAPPPTSDRATLVLVGGEVVTNLPDQPRVEAVAVRGSRILAIGDAAAMAAVTGPDTRVIDLGGRTVTVGLTDGHCHLYGLGVAEEQVNLRGLPSEQAAVARGGGGGGRARARRVDRGARLGSEPVGWRVSRPGPRSTPPWAIARWRCAASTVTRCGCRARSLRLAKITKATPDPAGGKIIRDASGEPTGVLIDQAMMLVDGLAPPIDDAVRARRIRAAAARAIAVGLTGVHEMGIDDATAAVYQDLAKRGELPLRVTAYLEGDPAKAAALAERAVIPDDGDDYFALIGVKYFADGALGSRGAALHADYSDDPGNRGLWVTEPAALTRAVAAASAAGWQVATHAIGDAGVGATLDAYAAAIAANPGQDLRLRVEHAQVMTAADIARLAQLGVIASMQPTHATSDMPWAEARLGPERIVGAYAWRSIAKAGGFIVAGSDFPVEDVAPLGGVFAAVTRTDAKGQPAGGWYPDQRLTLDEALIRVHRGAGPGRLRRGPPRPDGAGDGGGSDGVRSAPDRRRVVARDRGRPDDRRRRDRLRARREVAAMRFCPFCSAENPVDAVSCATCARRLPPPPNRRARTGAGPATGIVPRRMDPSVATAVGLPVGPTPGPVAPAAPAAVVAAPASVAPARRVAAPAPVDDARRALATALLPPPTALRRTAPPPEPRPAGVQARRKDDAGAAEPPPPSATEATATTAATTATTAATDHRRDRRRRPRRHRARRRGLAGRSQGPDAGADRGPRAADRPAARRRARQPPPRRSCLRRPPRSRRAPARRPAAIRPRAASRRRPASCAPTATTARSSRRR